MQSFLFFSLQYLNHEYDLFTLIILVVLTFGKRNYDLSFQNKLLIILRISIKIEFVIEIYDDNYALFLLNKYLKHSKYGI